MKSAMKTLCQVHGPITELDRFFGRKHELRRILQSLKNDESVWVVGGPKVGKTSFLYWIQQVLDEPSQVRGLEWNRDLLGVYINVRQKAIQSHQGLFLSAFREISDRISSFEVDLEAEFDRLYIKDRLGALQPDLVLLLDDFESAIDSFTVDDFLALRALDSSHVLFVFGTVPRRVPVEHPGSDLFLSLRKEFLGPWTSEELDHFLEEISCTNGINLMNYKQHILDLAGRFPYLVQLVCRLYVQTYLEHEPSRIDDRDPELIRDKFASKVKGHFAMIWEGFDHEKREVVAQLARGEWNGEAAFLATVELEREGYLIDGKLFSTVFEDFVEKKP